MIIRKIAIICNLENFKQNQQHLSKLKLLFLHFPQIEKQEKQNCKKFPRKASWLLIEVIYYPHFWDKWQHLLDISSKKFCENDEVK